MIHLVTSPESKPAPTAATKSRTPAEAAVAAAVERLEASRAQLLAEKAALEKATSVAREADAELKRETDPSSASFHGFARGAATAHTLVEAHGDRVELASQAVAAAQQAVNDAELELKRETIRRLDEQIRVENLALLDELANLARSMTARVMEMKAKAWQANSIEATLPGYQPPWDGRPSCRLSALVDAPHPHVQTSAAEILFQAAHYTAANDEAAAKVPTPAEA